MLLSGRPIKAVLQFHATDATYYAAGIAFYLLFALTPFLLLTLSVAALFTNDSQAYLNVFHDWFSSNLPSLAAPLEKSLLHIFQNRGQIGMVGLVWLFLSARKLVGSIEIGLNAVLDIEKPQTGVLKALTSVAFIGVSALLFLSAVLAMAAIDFASGVNVWFLKDGAGQIGALILKSILGAAVSVALFFAIYRMFPAKGLSSRNALIASTAASIMWIAARQAFIWYGAKQLVAYEEMYGWAAGFLFMLLWAYVFGIVLLMGACFVKDNP